MITTISITSCVLALIPAVLFLRNLALYRPLPPLHDAKGNDIGHDSVVSPISVLIPARNEEANIAEALRSILRSSGIDFEIVVLDDDSTDRTAEMVRKFAVADSRVRLETTQSLPSGWCGKPFVCNQLAALARHPLLVFIDADVRVSRPDSLARLARFVVQSGAALVSGVPRQEMRCLMEKIIIPLIHFVLLGFLPFRRMRAGTDPRYAAACGQIVAVRQDAYKQAGGHASIPDRLHDGVALARTFRAHGLPTDLFDATDTFHCRMYGSASEVWFGFAKNAGEALASPKLIVPSTLFLLGSQVLPLVMLGFASSTVGIVAAALGTVAAFLPRFAGAARFRQSLLGALLHPVGITTLVAIQWFAFFRSIRRYPAVWKGRAYLLAPAL